MLDLTHKARRLASLGSTDPATAERLINAADSVQSALVLHLGHPTAPLPPELDEHVTTLTRM